MGDAVEQTEMAYGGITPIGLPQDWPILIDSRVIDTDHVVIGSGIRGSKLIVPGTLLGQLATAEVIEKLGLPPTAA
jgi:prolyl-tRNA editing enzyme YbaK/EbsC (Cys-tRNA(Pro) deacylase)